MVRQKRMRLEADKTDSVEQEKMSAQAHDKPVQKRPMLTRANSGYWGLGKPISNSGEVIDIRGNQGAEKVCGSDQSNNTLTSTASQMPAASADLVNNDSDDVETALTPESQAEQSEFAFAFEIIIKFKNTIIAAFKKHMFASWINHTDQHYQAIAAEFHEQLAPLLTTKAIKDEFKQAIEAVEDDSQRLTTFLKQHPKITVAIAKLDTKKLEILTLAWLKRLSRFQDYHISNSRRNTEYIMQLNVCKNPIFGKMLPTRNRPASTQTANTAQQSGLLPQ